MSKEKKQRVQMTFSQMLAASRDWWHKPQYELKKYLIEDGKLHKFALVCPGGGYSMVCSFLEGEPFVADLQQAGYHVFILYYATKKNAAFPGPMDDLARAVREISAHAKDWHVDMAGYSVWGFSAGGHLAASYGTESMGYQKYHLPKPAALVLSYPVVTMDEMTHGGSREWLLGKEPTPEMIALTSVEKQVTKDYPPTFLWCGDCDTTVPPENSHRLDEALTGQGIFHEFHEYPGVEHGVGLGVGLACEGWQLDAIRFWEKARQIQPESERSIGFWRGA